MTNDDDARDDELSPDALRKISLDSAFLQLRLLHELKGRKAHPPDSPNPEPPPPNQAGAYGRAGAQTDATDLLFDLARLSVRNYEQLLALGTRHFDYIAASVRRIGGGGPVEEARIELKAPVGKDGTATLRLIVENPFGTNGKISFTLPQFRSTRNDHPLSAKFAFIRIDRPEPVLEPAESARLELRVSVDPSAPAGTYRSRQHALVGSNVLGQVDIEIEVPEGAETTA